MIEHEASYIGRQIILDFWRRSEPHVVIERLVVSSENVDTVSEKLRMASLPTVAVFNSDNQTVTPLEIVHTNSAGCLALNQKTKSVDVLHQKQPNGPH